MFCYHHHLSSTATMVYSIFITVIILFQARRNMRLHFYLDQDEIDRVRQVCRMPLRAARETRTPTLPQVCLESRLVNCEHTTLAPLGLLAVNKATNQTRYADA
jgi:hypothetical protein